MKQVTRRLLKLRNADYVDRVRYAPHPESTPNYCVQNAFAEAKRSGSQVAAGWVVGDYFKQQDSTPVMFHFWNIDSNGNHYDTTPEVAQEADQHYEYVIDYDLYNEVTTWNKANPHPDGNMVMPPVLKFFSNELLFSITDNSRTQETKNFEWMPMKETAFTIGALLDFRQNLLAVN